MQGRAENRGYGSRLEDISFVYFIYHPFQLSVLRFSKDILNIILKLRMSQSKKKV